MRAALVLIVVSACAPAQPINLPEAPLGTKTMIFALDDPECHAGRCRNVHVHHGAIFDRELSLPIGNFQLYALYYPWSPEELMIFPGELTVCDQNCTRGSRALPLPQSMRRANLRGTELQQFEDVAELPNAIATLMLPAIDPVACASLEPPHCFQAVSELPSDLDERARELRCIPCPTKAEPNAPNMPRLILPPDRIAFDCPPGWRVRTIGAALVCDPVQPPHVDCPLDQVHFFGGEGCGPIGGVCPAPGDFREDVPDNALFVREGATGGNGAMTSPFGTIAEAIQIAVPAQTIVLAAGRYEVCILDGLSLLGACASDVTLHCPNDLLVLDGSSAIEDVTVEGTVLARAGSSAVVRNVRINGKGRGCFHAVLGGVADVNRLVVSNCSEGLYVETATVAADGVIVEDGVLGVGALHGAVLNADNVIVGDSLHPLVINDASTATISGASLVAYRGANITIDASNVLLRNIYTRATSTRTDDLLALHAALGSTVAIETAHFDGARGAAVAFNGDPKRTVATLSDVVITNVEPGSLVGFGIHSLGNVVMSLERVLIEDAAGQGLLYAGSAGGFSADHLAVVTADRKTSIGISLHDTIGTLNHVYVAGTSTTALSLSRSEVDLKNASLENLEHGGITLIASSKLTGGRLRFEQVRAGVYSNGHNLVDLSDVSGIDLVDFAGGAGNITFRGVELAGASSFFLSEEGATLTAYDVSLNDVENGLRVVRGGPMVIERLSSVGHRDSAITARSSGNVMLSHVALSGSGTPDPAIELLASPAAIRDTAISGSAYGVFACGALATLSNVRIENVDTGLKIGGATLGIQSFVIEETRVGLTFDDTCTGETMLVAQDGRVHAREIALELPRDFDLSRALHHVSWDAPYVLPPD